MSDVIKKPSATDGETKNEPTPVVSVGADLVKVLMEQNRLLQEDALDRAEERRKKKEEVQRKQDARKRNAGDPEAERNNLIKMCDHLKGGRFKAQGKIDYSLSVHTFISGEVRIACQSCPLKLWSARDGGKVPEDTKEWIWITRGKGWEKTPNVSGIGFAEARTMLKQSTNKPSSSERVVDNPLGQIAAANQALDAKDAEIAALKATLGKQ